MSDFGEGILGCITVKGITFMCVNDTELADDLSKKGPTVVWPKEHYDELRSRGKTHHQALRALANRWVGILHGCLRWRSTYSENVAWPTPFKVAA